MADRAKKRKAASPHSHETSNKRNRKASTETSSKICLAKGSVPTSTDYRFRLKVIASANDVGDDIFQDAVQGLVQICFPESILDELGVDVIAAHMEQDGARAETIRKMRSVFNTLMIQHMSRMLARYIDTPEKLERAVSTISDASQVLHGPRRSLDATNDPSNVCSSGSCGDVRNTSDSSGRSSDSSAGEPVPQGKARKKKGKAARIGKGDKRTPKFQSMKSNETGEERKEGNLRLPKSLPVQALPISPDQGKVLKEEADKRVSATWRWNIDPSKFACEEIGRTFRKTSDLFAYHALPIVRRDLVPTANRKEIRKKIQSALTGISDEEYHQWADSLQKLHGGDLSMLERAVPERPTAKTNVAHAIPALSSQPCKTYSNEATQKQQIDLKKGDGRMVTGPLPGGGPPITVKQERAAGQEQFPLPAVGAPEISNGDPGLAAATRVSAEYDVSTNEPFDHQTPIVNLLFGVGTITMENRNAAVQTIMNSLDKRVLGKSTSLPMYNGSTRYLTYDSLPQRLKNALPRMDKASPAYLRRLRILLEIKIRPLVLTYPASFPELRLDPLFFVHAVPSNFVVMHLLVPQETQLTVRRVKGIAEEIVGKLQQRGYSESGNGPSLRKIHDQILSALEKPYIKADEISVRGEIEKYLRAAAFARKDLFPELCSSIVVTSWERATGLKWE